MRGMLLLSSPGRLVEQRLTVPEPSEGELLLKVHACGICRTDLHLLDGELPDPLLPLVPGHQIVGEVIDCRGGCPPFRKGDMVGVPWLGKTCGVCPYCREGRENLCDSPLFTGYTRHGGFAEYTVADARFAFPIPPGYPPEQAAPLLCAGLIGYRSLRFAGDARRIGVFGFGSAAHIVTQIARHEGREILAFTRDNDTAAREFARSLGAVWAGGVSQSPPAPLDAAIIFAPAGELVPRALQLVRKGGTVVCGGIHMSAIPSFPYDLLWGERRVVSVANLTRQDGIEFMELAPRIPIITHVTSYTMEKAQTALDDLREGRVTGSLVLTPGRE
ncbi:MAG: zinc-dependent alcohol dehydrogenase family protein [Desulfuromonadia bacterium]